MGKFKDLTGKKFGRLTVIERNGHKGRVISWLCKCDCGNEITISVSNLTSGNTKSCGCYRSELAHKSKHKLSRTRIYKIWDSMKRRCYKETSSDFKNYGARGITICREWRGDFKAFYDWATANGYKENLTIDRINVNGNYEPSNCRWATKLEQARNRRNNVFIEHNGKLICLAELAEKLNISYKKLQKNQDKITYIQNWLKDNFEVKDEKN